MTEAEELSTKYSKLVERPTYFSGGHRLCAGCNAGIMARLVTMAFTRPAVVVQATGCLEVASTIYPFSAWKVPWLHCAFENAAATASGVEAAYRTMRKKGIRSKDEKIDVVIFAGDGGTYDIGLQSLSGALERGHDLLYICYNNGAYMNTGIQRSGATPRFASTTTSPAGSVIPGKMEFPKDLTAIVVAHDTVQFAATTTTAHPRDLIGKVRAALDVDGPTFLLVDSPCQRGWRIDASLGLEMNRLAVETCFFPVYTVDRRNGKEEWKLDTPSRKIARRPELKKPIVDYMKPQGRFRHIFRRQDGKELIEQMQAFIDKKWEALLVKCGY
ncbi:MAG: thiamine pyrophosphate-dependent enzyme [Candidatus Hodarchaeales archaeon]|jgi:pyruvate ferredoxin oxidoreductase beta subunit